QSKGSKPSKGEETHDLPTAGNRFSAVVGRCLVSALPACRIYFSIRQQQQVDGSSAENLVCQQREVAQPEPRQSTGCSSERSFALCVSRTVRTRQRLS